MNGKFCEGTFNDRPNIVKNITPKVLKYLLVSPLYIFTVAGHSRAVETAGGHFDCP